MRYVSAQIGHEDPRFTLKVYGTLAGEMMANVLATFAQFERRLIGQRTNALAIVRQNGSKSGWQIGNPAFRAFSWTTVALILELRSEGTPYRGGADVLNQRAIPTAQGGRRWHAQDRRQYRATRRPGRCRCCRFRVQRAVSGTSEP